MVSLPSLASTTVFLASGGASFVNSTDLFVDGGQASFKARFPRKPLLFHLLWAWLIPPLPITLSYSLMSCGLASRSIRQNN
jgi:hypothetical protein